MKRLLSILAAAGLLLALAGLAGTGDWLEGRRFRSSASQGEVQAWVQELNLPAASA